MALRVWNWLRRAFAVEPPNVTPTDKERELVDGLCRMLHERDLVMPALLMLEGCQPLGYLGSQTLQFFAPVLTALCDPQAYQTLTTFLEKRGAVEYVCQRLGVLDSPESRVSAAERPPDDASAV